jgi:hypothetical protein
VVNFIMKIIFATIFTFMKKNSKTSCVAIELNNFLYIVMAAKKY